MHDPQHKLLSDHRLLLSLSLSVSTAKDVDTALNLVLQKICDTTSWVAGDAWFRDIEQGSMVFRTIYCEPEYKGRLRNFCMETAQRSFTLGEGLPGCAWQRKNSIWVEDILTDACFVRKDIAWQSGIRSAMAIPIPLNDETLAVLCFYLLEHRPLDKDFVELVTAVATQLGVLLKQKDTEDILRASELKFRSLMEASPEAIIITSSDGIIIDTNPCAEAMFGYEEGEMNGKLFTRFLPEPYSSYLEQKIKTPEWAGEKITSTKLIELEGLRKDGTRFPIEFSSAGWEAQGLKYFSATIRDITQRKADKEHLSRSRALLADAQALAHLGSFEIDVVNGKINWSDENYRIFGLEPQSQEVTRELIRQLIPSIEHDTVFGIERDTIEAKEGHSYEVTIARADGEERIITGFVRPVFDKEGQVIKLIGYNQDITERRNAEMILKEKNAELARSNYDLEQFAYIASHDLQEPLRMISSYTDILARRYQSALDADAQEFLKYISEGAIRMRSLVNGLLQYSRAGSHTGPLQEVDFNHVLQTVKRNLILMIEETDAIVEYKDLPVVTGEETQLVQLMQNLISNSLKFRAEDAVPCIAITARAIPGYWEFTVADNGIGILPKHQNRIFQIFQRLHSREAYPGTGIGLALCKKIVERHGGTIWLDTQAKAGATFKFTLKR